MRVVLRIISTGGVGAGRVTRYIAERDKDPLREDPGSRPLFSQDQEGLTYRTADRVLDPSGEPQKGDLLHLSVSFEEADFEKLGADEKERQARLREVIREGMKGRLLDPPQTLAEAIQAMKESRQTQRLSAGTPVESKGNSKNGMVLDGFTGTDAAQPEQTKTKPPIRYVTSTGFKRALLPFDPPTGEE